MPQIALGPITVTTPGVKVRITVNLTDPNAPIYCQSVLIQVFSNGTHTNTGRVYILNSAGSRMATLAVPATSTVPSFSATIPTSPGALLANDYYIDSDNPLDGADASYTTP